MGESWRQTQTVPKETPHKIIGPCLVIQSRVNPSYFPLMTRTLYYLERGWPDLGASVNSTFDTVLSTHHRNILFIEDYQLLNR